MSKSRSLRVVTGASANHGKSLLQLLRSLKRWERNTAVAVYDLGLEDHHVEAVRQLGFEPIVFPFSDYPPHFDISFNAGAYAWKVAIIKLEMDKGGAPLLWLDAGNLVRFPLLWVRYCLRRDGFFCPKTWFTVTRYTHPGMYEVLGIPVGWAGERKQLNAAIVGVNHTFPSTRALVDEWLAGAMEESIIAPPGSSRDNHRWDQSLLTLLAYRAGILEKPSRTEPGILTHQDIPEGSA